MNIYVKHVLIFSMGVVFSLVFIHPIKSLVYALVSLPDSGSESRLETLYNSVVSLGNGSDSSGSWGNWGSMWNRVRSSSEWVPSGDATAGDVVSGKTFYGGSRELVTGTAPEPVDFTNMQYSSLDDYAGIFNWGSEPEDYQGEESMWTDYSYLDDVVWKDERSGNYWAGDESGFLSNIFVLEECDFFNSVPRGSYTGIDVSCGNAINYCAELTYGDRDDWYLPSQKELMLAYIDGIYNRAGDTLGDAANFAFGLGYDQWTSTEYSYNSNVAFFGNFYDGSMLYSKFKTSEDNVVRCVARD